MKKEINFNHNSKKLSDAIGLNEKEIFISIQKAVESFCKNETEKVSHLSEILHKSISYEIILFLATKELDSMLEKINSDILREQLGLN